jgi:hypothetical protein
VLGEVVAKVKEAIEMPEAMFVETLELPKFEGWLNFVEPIVLV